MVLVPFYRGAVVFITKLFKRKTTVGSRPLLSRSGCISQIDMYELLIDSKEKLEKFMSEGEWQSAIEFMDKLLEV